MRSVLVGLHLVSPAKLRHEQRLGKPVFRSGEGKQPRPAPEQSAAEAQQKTGFGSHLNFVISDCLFYLSRVSMNV